MNLKKTIQLNTAILFSFVSLLSVTSCNSQGVTFVNQTNEQQVAATEISTLWVEISMEGGTGRAHIESPVKVSSVDGDMSAVFVWNSENYDYMIVDGVKYDNENPGGPSTFTVHIDSITEPLSVIGDTVAMSTPHEIEYTIKWGESTEVVTETLAVSGVSESELFDALEKAGLSKTGELDTSYAVGYRVTKFGEYSVIAIDNSGVYLLIPEGGEVPAALPDGVTLLYKPLDETYLVTSSAMDLIVTLGALDRIALSGTKASDWYVDEAKEAMEAGDLLYAGRYRAPDYELLLTSGCDIAIENTMIYHEPGVIEKLRELGIPVLIETSSYENNPLGRLEWIKLYGVLFDLEDEADAYFENEINAISDIIAYKPDTGMQVAFFHVTANGSINVRKNGDYITCMIDMAGGHYVPENAGDGSNALSTMNMQMEDFYAGAKDADILIYNSTIGGEIASIDELIALNPLFADFKAVKEGRVYCTERNLFQQTTGMADFLTDLNDVFSGVDREYTYINRLY